MLSYEAVALKHVKVAIQSFHGVISQALHCIPVTLIAFSCGCILKKQHHLSGLLQVQMIFPRGNAKPNLFVFFFLN